MTEIIYDVTSLSAAYGGAEIFCAYQNIANLVVKIKTNIGELSQFLDPNIDPFYTSDIALSTFENGGETYIRCQVFLDDAVIDQADFNIGCGSVEIIHARIVFDKSAVSVYADDLWVYTYVFTTSIWPEENELKLSVSGSDVQMEIINVELADPREAVYIDYEQTTDSAIQSIIQQRPIQIFAEVGRANTFTYWAIRDDVPVNYVISYEEITEDNQQLSSDGLVYYLDVGISNSGLTAEQVGLITRLYRLSDLDNGAVQATKRLQQIAIEHRKIINLSCRFDPRIEIADRLLIDAVVTGTQRHIQDQIIVESIQPNLRDGSYQMQISGRRSMS